MAGPRIARPVADDAIIAALTEDEEADRKSMEIAVASGDGPPLPLLAAGLARAATAPAMEAPAAEAPAADAPVIEAAAEAPAKGRRAKKVAAVAAPVPAASAESGPRIVTQSHDVQPSTPKAEAPKADEPRLVQGPRDAAIIAEVAPDEITTPSPIAPVARGARPLFERTAPKVELPKEEPAPAATDDEPMPAPKAEERTPLPKAEARTPAPKAEERAPLAKSEDRTPSPKAEARVAPAKPEDRVSPAKAEKRAPAPKAEVRAPVVEQRERFVEYDDDEVADEPAADEPEDIEDDLAYDETEADDSMLDEPEEIAPPKAAPAKAETPAPAPTIVDTSAAQKTVKAPPVKVVPAIGQGFRLPQLDMLEPPAGDVVPIDEEQLKAMAQLLEKTLADYGVSGKVEEIHPGPTVTTFEVSPAAGTKVSKVAGLADDLALGLSRKVRIIAPIPGKNRIGFEIPNERRMPVNLRELVEDKRFQEMKAPLPCVLGRDIIGTPYFADLASMPHVIVAGATGAGKSVGLNVMLVSLLYRRTPAELKMLMIDPKVVELAPFDRIPHMLLPVVTDMKQAANALKWAVDEMERRYQLFANAGTKNITTYNGWVEKVQRGEARPPRPTKVAAVGFDGNEVEIDAAKDGSDVQLPEKIPYIVIVVDEFADLMMQQGKDVEASVARLAQKARAAGMHVILATQRPSVDVITGMIKANFPTRIAFRVAQKVDSRTILDEQGAEHLLGRGDMLVKMNGTNDTRRVQCPFASEEEVQKVTDFLRLQGEPVYDENILKPRDEDGEVVEEEDAETDPMYDAAVRIVADTRRCSTSWIQRKLGVGYNRAAKIVEAMEKRGVVGPANGSKDREVLIGSI
ncbi:MAG: DNA translocase FtsK [Minicystis sp.]